MKKSNLFFAMAAGAMLVTSCASEQEMPNAPENNGADKQIITLTVENNNSTRAGRPLLSSEADQNIDFVKVIITDEADKIVWTKTIENWNGNNTTPGVEAGSGEYFNGNVPYGRQTSFEISKEEVNFLELAGEDEDYKFHIYAVGYSDDSAYNLTAIENATVDKTFTADLAIALKAGMAQKENWAEEIFAGDAEFAASRSIKANVVLNRQVAGTIGYMHEIPYVTDEDGNVGQYLHLVASNYCDQLVLGNFVNADHANNAGSKFVVNGTNATNKAQIIYTINLNDWFKTLTPLVDEQTNSSIIDPANWKNKTDNEPKHYHFVKGSVFAASFLHPFKKVTDVNTFRLILTTDAEGKNEVAHWDVTLSGAQTKQHTLTCFVGGENPWAETLNADTKTIYNVLRNNLYSIGNKPHVDPKDPTDPEDPDPDPNPTPDPDDDDPTPLNNKQQITIKVNSNWEVIHQMGLL